MRRDEEWDRRLDNWARYRLSMGSLGLARSRAFDEARVDGQGWDAPTVVPTNAAEAEETHAGVMALDSPLRAAVEVWYLHGGGVTSKCLRLCVSETTLRDRIALAHCKLRQWLSDKVAAQREQRRRVEALQLQARQVRTGPAPAAFQ